MRRIGLAALGALAMAGCNTVQGIGDDLAAGGEAISQAAQDVGSYEYQAPPPPPPGTRTFTPGPSRSAVDDTSGLDARGTDARRRYDPYGRQPPSVVY